MTPLASQIVETLKQQPKQFPDLVDQHLDVPWREFLRAWGEVRSAHILERDDDGNYFIGSSSHTSRKA
jgi:hypothetical protein